MIKSRFLTCAFLLLAAESAGLPAVEEPPIQDENVEVVHAERMVYPLYAKVRHIEGAVVIRAAVDAMGQVTDAAALSGPKSLLKEAAENVKKWRFSRPRQANVIVVFWFRFQGLCELPCPSGFEFYPPNVAVVSTGTPIVTP